MARHHSTSTSFGGTAEPTRPPTGLWRAALGPGYAVGPSGRLLDYVARASEVSSGA